MYRSSPVTKRAVCVIFLHINGFGSVLLLREEAWPHGKAQSWQVDRRPFDSASALLFLQSYGAADGQSCDFAPRNQ